jgi:CRISPR-associated protein Cmr3
MREWVFEPLDTLFFRSGLSIDRGEAGWLESIFPPSPQTMQGVVRSSIILSHCKDPKTFGAGRCDTCRDKDTCPLPGCIGTSKEGGYGSLDLYGPYLIKENNRYYSAPFDLMREKEGGRRLFSILPSDSPVICDLGTVRLPTKPQGSNYGAPDIAGGWIREDALQRYLDDSKYLPDGQDLLKEDAFFEREPRIGIARDYATHKVEEGMLYSIVPLRFKVGVKISVKVNGIDTVIEPKGFATNVGGEGRVCKLTIDDHSGPPPLNAGKAKRLKMVLLQPADFNSHWLPPDFREKKDQDFTYWEGSVSGIKLWLISACIGRPYKLGGWDMGKRAVKSMRCYVPAGSVYFFEAIYGDASELPVEGKIGNNQKIGFGHYLLGRW